MKRTLVIAGLLAVAALAAGAAARAADQPVITLQSLLEEMIDRKPFYYIVTYRAYEPGTKVETFSMASFEAVAATVESVGQALMEAKDPAGPAARYLPKVESRSGAVTCGHGELPLPAAFAFWPVPRSVPRSVSRLRSSNRTGGFPASGSRRRLHAFAHGKSRVRSTKRTRPSTSCRWAIVSRGPPDPRPRCLARNH